ncbi:hypothetical protein IMZ31_17120 [Pontibacillus sp. ALD_SL1]|uniref:DUF7686 domain-containing protein n=1 Tax=Pontibacillus sp. ALD_SL1 TaxID=2777185 RepID=UPI001A9748BA|nr:hypothetical protein [Pontibacillus sp. ALD_SL1]QSS99763.1 hypothetical protein IMZ31_17120 [Pontibacillus sp. ALD_SL1]
MILCDRCEYREATIVITSDRQKEFCGSCYNEMVSEEMGIKLEGIPEEVVARDYCDTKRTFNVQQRLYPNGIFLEAAENREYGYQFAVHGELECNHSELFQRLIDKVKRGVATQWIEEKEFPNGQQYHSLIEDQAVGFVDYNGVSSSGPMLVIDGRPYTWEQFGEIVKTYEGSQFVMKFFDETDDVD